MNIKDRKQIEHHIKHLEEMIGEGHHCYVATVKSLKNILEDTKEENTMENVDVKEMVMKGLREQFDQLGNITGYEGDTMADMARAKIETGLVMLGLDQLIKEEKTPICKCGTREMFESSEPLKINLANISTEELICELSKRDMTNEDFIEKWTKPLSDLLISAYTPYTQIVISTEGVRTKVTKGIPCNVLH